MTTLKESAKAYVPQSTKNIAELEVVPLDAVISEKSGTNKEGQPYNYFVATVGGEEYRVPSSVLSDLKTILTAKPNLKAVKVMKKGQGMNTSYTVITLD